MGTKFRTATIKNLRQIFRDHEWISNYQIVRHFVRSRKNECQISPIIYEMFNRQELIRKLGFHVIEKRNQQVWYYKIDVNYVPSRASPRKPRRTARKSA